jgi:uncharacterized membrane protein YbhN (UPF0104 family)
VRCAARSGLPYRRVALTSFTAMSLGHTVGFTALSSGVVRYRMYSHFGLGAADVARVVAFSAVTVAAGHAALAGAGGLLRPAAVAALTGIPPPAARLLGAGSLALLCAYVAACALLSGAERGWRSLLPPARVAIVQSALGALNYLCVAGALKRLLGEAADVSLLTFASLYVAGNALAILSHVPGGLGVLELVVLAALPGAEAVGALIVFRLIYFLIPFALGALLYAGFELARRRGTAAVPGSAGLRDGRHDRDVVGSDR